MLDFADIIVDQDFSTTFTVTRRAQTVDTNGIAAITTTTFTDVIGVVINDGNPLVLDADYTHATGTITVYTQMRLYDPTMGYQADRILFGGDTYQVRKVSNWSRFGFYAADCDMVNLTSAP